MIPHIRYRSELVEYAARHTAWSRTLRRAFDTGTVEVLGGFSTIPPWASSGWIIRVTSRFERDRLIAVCCDRAKPVMRVAEIDDVPWKYWDGMEDRKVKSFYDGDHPHLYAKKRAEAKHADTDH